MPLGRLCSNLSKPERPGLPVAAHLTVGIFLTCLLIYAVFWSGHHYSIDGVLMFQYAKALFFQRSFTMNPPVRWGADFAVGKWPIGLSVVYIPELAVLSSTIFLGNEEISQIPYDPHQLYNPALLSNSPYLFSSFLNPLVTAATAAALYLLCQDLGFSRKRSCAAALVFGLASPAAAYAKFDFAQPLASLLLLLSVLFLARTRRHGPLNLALAGIFLGYGILTRPELIIVAAPVLVIVAYFIQGTAPQNRLVRERISHVVLFGLPILGFAVLNQYLNYLRFGSWVSVGYSPTADFTLNAASIGTALLGNLVSPGRGILLFFPLGILSVLGFLKLSRSNGLFAWTFALLIAVSLFFYSTWKDWGGGVSWGPRFFVPLMPYFTLLALQGDFTQRLSKNHWISLFIVLAALGFIATFQGLAFNFLGVYGPLHIPQSVIDQGNYNFLPENSPLLIGWGHLFDPLEYDSVWLREFGASQGLTLFVLLAGLIGMLFAAKCWLDFFRAPTALERQEEPLH